MLLADLPNNTPAVVTALASRSPELDATSLQRLAELGFLPGEPVCVVQRGPGGREPLAVQVADTLFALRRAEALCVEVHLPGAGPASPEASDPAPAPAATGNAA